MVKSVFKELVIVLLLCLAIVLILGILFYEYIPIGKEIPEQINYSTSETVTKQIEEADELEKEDGKNSTATEDIKSDDLNNYRRTQDYVPGKANPFAAYDTSSGSTTNGSSTGSSSSGSTSGGSSSSTSGSSTSGSTSTDDSSSSGGHFFQNTGTK